MHTVKSEFTPVTVSQFRVDPTEIYNLQMNMKPKNFTQDSGFVLKLATFVLLLCSRLISTTDYFHLYIQMVCIAIMF